MAKELHVIFDGDVLRPEEPAGLKKNARYLISIEREEEAEPAYPLTEILKLATDMGVSDLSTRHRWYAHGGDEDGRHGS